MISTQRVNIYDELRISPAEWGYHYVVGRGRVRCKRRKD